MEIIDQTKETPVNMWDWFITIAITAIPLVGFIMLLVWAFGSDSKPSKASWAKATLLWYVLGVVLVSFALSLGALGAIIGMADQV